MFPRSPSGPCWTKKNNLCHLHQGVVIGTYPSWTSSGHVISINHPGASRRDLKSRVCSITVRFPARRKTRIHTDTHAFLHVSQPNRPEEGFAAKTKFHITCEKWTSVDTPLSYQFRYQVTADNLGKISSLPTERTRTELWSYGQDHSTPSSVLPIGNKENQYQMELRVRILNRYNSFQVQQLYVTVSDLRTCSHALERRRG